MPLVWNRHLQRNDPLQHISAECQHGLQKMAQKIADALEGLLKFVHALYGGFPKLIRGTFLEVPIIRVIIFWGLYWGPSILGNYHILIYVALASLTPII